MDLFQWDDSFKLNIAKIDEQHEQLISLISELDDAVRMGTGGQLIGYVLQELIRYVGVHFVDEERLMMVHDFPGLADHRRMHDSYVTRLREIQESYQESNALSSATLDFLKEWIATHIKGTDQIYGSFIRAKTRLPAS
jgi:hemerythrin